MSAENKSKEHIQLEKEFITAVQSQDINTVMNFFAEKDSSNIPQFCKNLINQAHTPDGYYAIHLAAIHKDDSPSILNFLLLNGANANIKTQNSQQQTALQLSILRKINCAMSLISHSEVNQLNADEYTNLVLHLIKAEEFLSLQNLLQKTKASLKKAAFIKLKIDKEYGLLYARKNNSQLFSILLEHGADPFYDYTSIFSTRRSVFTDAIAEENIADTAQMLLSQEKITDFKHILDFLNICAKKKDQYHLIDKVLAKAAPETRQKALCEWAIDEEYCLLYAYKHDKTLLDILLKHGASSFYSPSSSKPSPFVLAMSMQKPDIDTAYTMLLNAKKIDKYQKIPCLLHELIKAKDKEKLQKVIIHLATATDILDLRGHMGVHNPSLVDQALRHDAPEFIILSVENLNYHFRIYYHHIASMIKSKKFDLAYFVLKKREDEHEFMHYFWVDYQLKLDQILQPIIEQDQDKLFFIFYNSSYWLRSVTHIDYLTMAATFAPKILATIIINQPKLIEKNIKLLITTAMKHNPRCHAILVKKFPQPDMQLADQRITKIFSSTVDNYTQTENESNSLGRDSPVKANQHSYKENPEEYYSPENEF